MDDFPELTPEQEAFVDGLLEEYQVLKEQDPHCSTEPFLARCRSDAERAEFNLITNMETYLTESHIVEQDTELFGGEAAIGYLEQRVEEKQHGTE